MRKKLGKKSKDELLEISLKCYELLDFLKNKTKLGKIKDYNNYVKEIFK